MTGASTINTAANANGAAQWSLTRSSQYVNAPIIATAPCAKLKMPDAVYVTTSPLAAMK